MLHEVLFALAGHSGGVFIDKGDGIQVLFYDIIHTKTTVPLHRWPWMVLPYWHDCQDEHKLLKLKALKVAKSTQFHTLL